MNHFDFLNSVNQTKQDLMVDEQAEKDYSPFMVCRGLSYFIDTVMYANEVNMLPHLDKRLHWDFLINSPIKSRKRFSKWHKAQKDEDVQAVMKCYGYSIDKARSVMNLLTDEDKKKIRESVKEE